MQVGIYLGQKAAAAALVQPTRKGQTVLAEAHQNLPDSFWQGDPKAITATLRDLARALGTKARRADVPCFIGIPEHHIREERIHFADLPSSPAELTKLIDWRIARDYRLESGSFALAHQTGTRTEAETELVVRTGPKSLITDITAAARKSGFTVARVEGVGAFLAPTRADSNTLSVTLHQTDCEAISQFAHASLPVPPLHRETLDLAAEGIAQALTRMAKANGIVTGAEAASYTLHADPALTEAIRARLTTDTPLTHHERLDVTQLARLIAANAQARSTSFTPSSRPRPKLAAFALSLIGLAALAAIVTGITQTRDIQTRTAKLDAHIAAANQPDPAATGAPEITEINALGERVTFYNSLIGPRHADLGTLLDALEQALPPGTWLRRLAYDTARGTVSVQVASEDEANLAPALAAIEATDALTSVILDRQIQVRSGQRVLSQYDISGVAK